MNLHKRRMTVECTAIAACVGFRSRAFARSARSESSKQPEIEKPPTPAVAVDATQKPPRLLVRAHNRRESWH